MKRPLALAVAACLGLAAVAPARAAPPVRVAVLPVVVHANEGHDYLRSGLADMLSSRIGQTPGVAVVRVDDPATATNDAEKAREAARAVGADYVVYGSFTTFGNGASLDLTCTAVRDDQRTPAARQAFVQAGTLGEIIPKLDALAERMARFAVTGEAPPPVAAAPPAAVGTGNGKGPKNAEVQALLERVEALERAVFRAKDEAVEETDLRDDGLGDGGAHDETLGDDAVGEPGER